MPVRELNLLGEICPFPLFETQKAIAEMGAGESLVVKTDFNQSVRNILKWCEDQCLDFELDEIGDGLWQITIIKG